VAFLGLGIMGSRQAANLARAGFDLTVWNRTAATAERFAQHGATLARTPAEAAANAEFVITMVVDGGQVSEVPLGEDGSAMLDLRAGSMPTHDFSTQFMLKDVRLCLEEGQALGVPFPSAADTREVLTAAMGMRHADDDFAAMIEPLENAAGTRL